MAIFQELRTKRFSSTACLLVVLSLVMSLLVFPVSPSLADDSAHDMSVVLDAGSDSESCPHHTDAMESCSVACGAPTSQRAAITTPISLRVVKWVAVNTLPANIFFRPPQRPPQA